MREPRVINADPARKEHDRKMNEAAERLALTRPDLAERIYSGADYPILSRMDRVRFERGEVLPAVEISRRDEFDVTGKKGTK
jgi:hypothetical protein